MVVYFQSKAFIVFKSVEEGESEDCERERRTGISLNRKEKFIKKGVYHTFDTLPFS